MLVTRPRHQAGELVHRLKDLGAEPIELPLIEIMPIDDPSSLDEALRKEYDWAIFTSANAVAAVFDRGIDLTARKVAAVGAATARALARHEITADCLPPEPLADAILTSIGDVAGRRILLPQADIARNNLADGLRAQGAIVTSVAAYRTVPAGSAAADLERFFSRGVDVVTFFSPSAVRTFAALLRPDIARAKRPVVVACVGPVTAAAAREIGLSVDVVASDSTAKGVVEAIMRRMEGRA